MTNITRQITRISIDTARAFTSTAPRPVSDTTDVQILTAEEKAAKAFLSFGVVKRSFLDQPAAGPKDDTYVKTREGTLIIGVLPNGELVITRQLRRAGGYFVTEFVAGKMEGNEVDTTKGALKELREETGFEPRKVIKLGDMRTNTNPDFIIGEREHVYLVILGDMGKATPEPVEKIALYRGSPTTILQGIKSGVINDAKTIGAMLLYTLWAQRNEMPIVDGSTSKGIEVIDQLSISHGPYVEGEKKIIADLIADQVVEQKPLLEAENFSVMYRLFRSGIDAKTLEEKERSVYRSVISKPSIQLAPRFRNGDVGVTYQYMPADNKYHYLYPNVRMVDGYGAPENAFRVGAMYGLFGHELTALPEFGFHPGWLRGERRTPFSLSVSDAPTLPTEREHLVYRATKTDIEEMIHQGIINDLGTMCTTMGIILSEENDIGRILRTT